MFASTSVDGSSMVVGGQSVSGVMDGQQVQLQLQQTRQSVDGLQMIATTSTNQHHHQLAQHLSQQLAAGGNLMGGNSAAAAVAAAAIAGMGMGVCPSTLTGLSAGGGNILLTTSSPIIPGGSTTVVFATHAAAAMAAMGGATVLTTCDGSPGSVGVPSGTVLMAAPVSLAGMPQPRM